MQKAAHISDDSLYRYSLSRVWGSESGVCFIGLNPSTADHRVDDPTIRRCIGFAKLWGYESLEMVNLFAFRATDPRVMKSSEDPVGSENNNALFAAAERNKILVACWGLHGSHMRRDKVVKELLHEYDVYHLGMTKAGAPRHPLYLRSDTPLQKWL